VSGPSIPENIIDAIRARPGMYVGDVDGGGLLHLLWELVGNAVDEHLAGFCTRIDVTLHDDRVTVADDGRGISVDPLVGGLPLLVHVLTHLHDRATFDGHPTHVHLDGAGIGLVAVSATSRLMVVETTRAGRRYRVELQRGVAGPVLDLGAAAGPGTCVTFAPDPEIFSRVDFDVTAIRQRLAELSGFCPGLGIRCVDERRGPITCPGGLAELLVRQHPGGGKLLTPPLHARGERDGVRVEIALTWASGAGAGGVRSYLNLHETRDGGTHVTGLLRGLNALVPRNMLRRAGIMAELRKRLAAIVSVLHHDPRLDSPTRSKLASPEVLPLVERVVRECLEAFTRERPEEVAELLADCVRAVR
jgi:DNA gyrase subunit B